MKGEESCHVKFIIEPGSQIISEAFIISPSETENKYYRCAILYMRIAAGVVKKTCIKTFIYCFAKLLHSALF